MNKLLCVVSCPIDCYSGYSARSRDFVKALYELKSTEWNIKILGQRWGSTPWGYIEDHIEDWGFLKDMIIDPMVPLPNQPDVWIQITVPNEFQPIGSKFNIGVTAGIETTVCDPSWIEGLNRMNLNLVSSNHAKETFERSVFEKRDQKTNQLEGTLKLEKPVEVLFEGLDLNKYFKIEDDDIESSELVDHLDSIEEDFCFLSVGHWLQGEIGEDRKNIALTIKYFLETFKGTSKKKPALVLKTSGASSCVIDREEVLKKIDMIRYMVSPNQKDLPNIYLIHGELEDKDINDLYNHGKIKAMVSFTKGEGYGRPLLEFTVSEKPVIASNWSGHTDFLKQEFNILVNGRLTNVHRSAHVPNMLLMESQWFSVEEATACDALRKVYTNYDKIKVGAKRQARVSKTEFSFEKMKERLNEYLDRVPKNVGLVLPKLEKIKL